MNDIILYFEPSKRLSEILGFPYYIQRTLTFSEASSILTKEDIEELEKGNIIQKRIPIQRTM